MAGRYGIYLITPHPVTQTSHRPPIPLVPQIWVISDGPEKGLMVGFSIPLTDKVDARPTGDEEMRYQELSQPPARQGDSVRSLRRASEQGPGTESGPRSGSVQGRNIVELSIPTQVAPPSPLTKRTTLAERNAAAKDDEIRPSVPHPAIGRESVGMIALQCVTGQNDPPQVSAMSHPKRKRVQGDTSPSPKNHPPRDMSPTPGSASDPVSTKVHVLVVEDSQICRTMLKKFLGAMSCTVQEAEVRTPCHAS
jgi:hypothetical protein